MELIDKIISLSDKYEDETIAIRREIHQNPELSNKEYETSKLVEEYLLDLGIEVKRIGETAILGTLEGKEKGKTLLLRADMDALPIEEETDLTFKSKNKGVMHACGHDVHTANLLIVAKILKELKDDWKGIIKFAFQPAEERGGGAKEMINLGILEDPKVDLAMGLHIMPDKGGRILINDESVTAYSDGFKFTIRGRKAHTRKPQEGVDAINIAAHILVALNSIISKNISPLDRATFSVAKIKGGTATNVVSDKVEMLGMSRSLDKEARDTIRERIETIAKETANMFGGEAEVKFKGGYPSVYNDKEQTKLLLEVFEEQARNLYKSFNIENPKSYIIGDAKPILASEDFGFFSQEVPSVYYMVGTGDNAPGHSSKFLVDEEWIKLCTRTMTLASVNYLNEDLTED